MELKNITGEFLFVALIENYIPKAGFFLSDFVLQCALCLHVVCALRMATVMYTV